MTNPATDRCKQIAEELSVLLGYRVFCRFDRGAIIVLEVCVWGVPIVKFPVVKDTVFGWSINNSPRIDVPCICMCFTPEESAKLEPLLYH